MRIPQQGHDSILAFAHGDRAEAEELRRCLIRIREQGAEHEDDPVASRIQSVLEGRTTLRELIRDPVVTQEIDRGVSAFASQWAEMSSDERADLARAGRAASASLRDDLGLPPEADPAPIGELVVPHTVVGDAGVSPAIASGTSAPLPGAPPESGREGG